jgi:hypothetical protein
MSGCIIPIRRRSLEIIPFTCPNYGPWNCAKLSCTIGKPFIEDVSCDTGAIFQWQDCFVQYDIRYIDFWFTPAEETLLWRFTFYNIRFDLNETTLGIFEGGDVTFYQGNFVNIEEEMFYSVTFDYNNTQPGTTIKFYVNGNLSVTKENALLDIYVDNNIRSVFSLQLTDLTFFSAARGIPSGEAIRDMYMQGSNRSAEYEFCYNSEECSCEESFSTINGSATGSGSEYQTAAIVLGILLGVALVILALLLLWWIIRYFTSPKAGYGPTPLIEE